MICVLTMTGCQSGLRRCSGRACTADLLPMLSSNVCDICSPGIDRRNQWGVTSCRCCASCNEDPQAGVCILAIEGASCNNRRVDCTRLLGNKPTRLFEACGGSDGTRSGNTSQSLQAASAFDRGSAICEHERRQGSRVFLCSHRARSASSVCPGTDPSPRT